MYKALIFCFIALLTPQIACGADDCLAYKIRPRITVSAPSWTKQVVQPLREMDLLHGDVIATLVDNYDITGDVTGIEDGFCVSLKSVAATVGYSDFLVQIDIRHAPGTCTYNAVLDHEDEHIRAYLGVIDDLQTELHDAIYAAADAVMPIFVRDEADVDSALDMLNQRLQSHPDVILVKQKIRAAEEIRNKRVDENDDGDRIKRCM